MDHHLFFTDRAFRVLLEKLRQNRYGMLGTLIAGLLAYGYAFTNKLPNPDDVFWLFNKGATLASGRWGLPPLSVLFPDYSMPWIYGIFTLLLLAVAICLILKLFHIQNPIIQLLLAAVMVTFPSQICTYTYMFTACAYAVAFLLSVGSVALLRRGRWPQILAGFGCLIYSVAIYQAYVSIAATLLILLLIQDLLTTNESVPRLFRRGVGYVLFLAGAMGCYWLITRLLLHAAGTWLGAYASYALTFTPDTLLEGIHTAYIAFRDIFLHSYHGLIPTFLSRCVHLVCLLAVTAELVLRAFRGKDLPRALLLAFLVAVLPLGMNCMFLLFNPDAIHTLVLYSFSGLYILFAILLEDWQPNTSKLLTVLRSLVREGLVVSLLVITLTNIYIANESYLYMHLAYENTMAVTTTVYAQISARPDYTPDTQVALMGKWSPPEYYEQYFSRLKNLKGTEAVDPTIYSVENFWKYYCSFPITMPEKQELEALYQSEAYLAMPVWPNAGSVDKIGDIIVVKFS